MGQTLTDAGNVAVPISSILDALKDVLTEEERTALFTQLIGLRPAGVAPGDLITAELFNQMMSDLNGLAIRVSALEGAAGGPVIDTLDPSTTVAVNSPMIVTGRNFNSEPRFNVVKIGNVEITQFRADSTPTKLIFMVPDMFVGLPGDFQVRVLDGERISNAMPIKVVEPDQTQKGVYIPQIITSPAGQVAAEAVLNFTWNVQAMTSFPDKVALELLVGEVKGTGVTKESWLATAQFQPAPPMSIQPGQTKSVSLTVKVPKNATSAQLALQITSEDGHVSNAASPIEVKVGQAIEPSSPNTIISFLAPTIGGAGMQANQPVEIDGLTLPGVLVKLGGDGKLVFTAADARQGTPNNPSITYEFSAELVAPGTGFVIGIPTPAKKENIPSGQDVAFDLKLKPAPGATAGTTGKLKVTVAQTKTGTDLTAYKTSQIIHLKTVS